jgi:hypothetical protein
MLNYAPQQLHAVHIFRLGLLGRRSRPHTHSVRPFEWRGDIREAGGGGGGIGSPRSSACGACSNKFSSVALGCMDSTCSMLVRVLE